TPQAAKLGYYLEVYRQQADTMTIPVRVMDTAGAVVVTAARLTVVVGAGGGSTEGTVDLSGLPPGRYRLEVQAAGRAGGGADTVSRRAACGVTGCQPLATAAAGAQPLDVFERMAAGEPGERYGTHVCRRDAREQGRRLR